MFSVEHYDDGGYRENDYPQEEYADADYGGNYDQGKVESAYGRHFGPT